MANCPKICVDCRYYPWLQHNLWAIYNTAEHPARPFRECYLHEQIWSRPLKESKFLTSAAKFSRVFRSFLIVFVLEKTWKTCQVHSILVQLGPQGHRAANETGTNFRIKQLEWEKCLGSQDWTCHQCDWQCHFRLENWLCLFQYHF